MTIKRCKLCLEKTKLKKFINFGDFPYANFPVNYNKFKNFIIEKKLTNKIFSKLNLLLCSNCNYLIIDKKPDDNILNNIYENFYTYPSPLEESFQPVRDDKFLSILYKNLFKEKVKTVFEVGCYDGYILHELKKKNYEVEGCEPSIGADIANSYGLNVYKGFFNKKNFYKKKYDLILIRHTLEHIYNLKKIISDLKYVMKSNSSLVIEVPNISYYIKKGLLEVFSLQHIHYFSTKTFINIAKKFNLSLIRFYETPENLILFLKKKQKKKFHHRIKSKIDFKKFEKKVFLNKKKINNVLNNYKDKKIVFWGAGGFAFAAIYLYQVKINEMSRFVDKDKKKQNLYFYDKKIGINSIESLRKIRPDLIVITSYYSSLIISEIKNLKIKSKVLILFPEIKLLKI
jgi:2-polyprenyl-3-methyl-5-hydroxy-6-metoxy-1,4-benzoquinol methylase